MLLNSIKKGARRILILQILIFLHCIEAGTCLEGGSGRDDRQGKFPHIPCNVPQMPMYKGFFEREMFANISYRLSTHLLYTIPIKDNLYEIYRRSMGDVQATSPVPCALYLSRSREIYRRCCPISAKFNANIKLHISSSVFVYLLSENKGMPSIGCSKACYTPIPMPGTK